MTDQHDLFIRLGLALAIGFLTGLERGWKAREDEEGMRTAGVRTFSLIGLMGGVFGALSRDANYILLAVGFLTMGATLAAYMWREGERDYDFSATSLIAAMLTFVLGAFAVLGDMGAAAGASVAALILLAVKEQLHGWVARLTWIELRAGLILAAMTFILLPLLPGRPIDPWNAINPYELWLMTILIAAVSFAGYAAVKVAGPETGLPVAAAAGGLVASTVVTLTLARMTKDNPAYARGLAGNIMLAGAVMFLRMLLILGVVSLPLALALLPGLGASALASGAAAFWLMRNRPEKTESGENKFNLSNPFSLIEVLRFGAILTIVMLLATVAQRYIGNAGLLAVAALSGLADVDAIALSVAKMAGGGVTPVLVLAVLIAAFANTAAKTVYAWTAGGGQLGRWVAGANLFAVAAGSLAQAVVSV